jgi:rhodanese-related sulfurtransferase
MISMSSLKILKVSGMGISVFTLCKAGIRSAAAAEVLGRLGIPATNVLGGMLEIKELVAKGK